MRNHKLEVSHYNEDILWLMTLVSMSILRLPCRNQDFVKTFSETNAKTRNAERDLYLCKYGLTMS